MNRLANVLLGAVAVVACGGSTTAIPDGAPAVPSSADASASQDGGLAAQTPAFVAPIELQGAGGPPLCFPQVLPVDPATGEIACAIYDVLPPGAPSCSADAQGLAVPAPTTVEELRADFAVPASQPICLLSQLPRSEWGGETCSQSTNAGWCYVTGTEAGPGCGQMLTFSKSGAPPAGTMIVLACE
jgi:hypothetical protein